MKKISIIMPVYNAERTLKFVLKSIIKQNFPKKDFELVLINDGSTDNSERIIKSFIEENKKILEIKYQKQNNAGCPAARNTGFKISNGKLIVCLDSDQEMSRNLLKECYEYSKKGARMLSIPEIGTDKGIVSRMVEYEKKINFHKTRRNIPRVFSREVILNIGLWNEKLWLGEDFDVYQRALNKGYTMEIVENSFVKHHEVNHLLSLIRKYYIYGKSAPKLLLLHRQSAMKMYSGMNKQLLRNLIYFFFKNPIMWFGAMFIKFVRYLSTFTGLLHA